LRKLEIRSWKKESPWPALPTDLVRYHGKMMVVDGKELKPADVQLTPPGHGEKPHWHCDQEPGAG